MVKKNKNWKKPVAAFSQATEKIPSVASPPTTAKVPSAVFVPWQDENPSWRIAKLQLVNPYGWHDVTGPKLLDIRQKLANYESMTWKQILKDHEYNHHVDVNRINSNARKRLSQIGFDSVDQLLRLRLTGTERVWGYRIGPVFHIIWWDPNHEICPSKLRHT